MTLQTRLRIALMVLLASLVAPLGAPSASASTDTLGWLRLSPNAGSDGDVMSVLTQNPCPSKAKALVVEVDGPGVPTDGSVGNIVGVVEIRVLKPTVSGQLIVPLSMVFRDWFAVNSLDPRAGKPYTLSLVCRDILRGSVQYGKFTGQVVFDSRGDFKAVGQAALPFNTTLKNQDPEGLDTVPTEPPAATDQSSAEATPPGPTPSTSESTVPPPSQPEVGSDETVENPAADATPAAAPAATTDGGGPGRFLMLGLLLILLAGLGSAFVSRRRGSSASVNASDDRTETTV